MSRAEACLLSCYDKQDAKEGGATIWAVLGDLGVLERAMASGREESFYLTQRTPRPQRIETTEVRDKT